MFFLCFNLFDRHHLLSPDNTLTKPYYLSLSFMRLMKETKTLL